MFAEWSQASDSYPNSPVLLIQLQLITRPRANSDFPQLHTTPFKSWVNNTLLWGLDTSGYRLHSGFHHKLLTTLLLPPHLFISMTSRPLLSPWEVTQATASVAVCPNDSKTFVHVVHLLWSPWEWNYSWLGTTSWKSQRYFHPSMSKIVLVISHSNPRSRPGSLSVSTLSQQLLHVSCYANQGPRVTLSAHSLSHHMQTTPEPCWLLPPKYVSIRLFSPHQLPPPPPCKFYHIPGDCTTTAIPNLLPSPTAQQGFTEKSFVISGCSWPMPPICLQCCPKHLGKRKI